jgi:hypothetical protein
MAGAGERRSVSRPTMSEHPLTIRIARPHDAAALQLLAGHDSAHTLSGRVLLAESDGTPIAAIAVDTGSVSADPFHPVDHAVRVLLLRRRQLISDATLVAPGHRPRRRATAGPAR